MQKPSRRELWLYTMHVFCRMFFISCMGSRRFQIPREPLPHGLFEHMQEKTMEILGEQSEEEMQEWLYDSLRWSENFWNQMDLEIYVNSERKLLKDVVYTEVYDQRRIDDWSESMHKTVTELAHREIKKDKRLANWAVDHIVESDKTYNLFKGGRKK